MISSSEGWVENERPCFMVVMLVDVEGLGCLVMKDREHPERGLWLRFCAYPVREEVYEYLRVKIKDKPADSVLEQNLGVRYGLAKRDSTDPYTLGVLALDRDADVRYLVAGNHSTPRGALDMLSRDTKWHVRYNVAKNISTVPVTLRKLFYDNNIHVASKAKVNAIIGHGLVVEPQQNQQEHTNDGWEPNNYSLLPCTLSHYAISAGWHAAIVSDHVIKIGMTLSLN